MNPLPGANSRNFRPSRRFACDRCRSFKLRCQRDEATGDACERCAKARLPCTTTFEHTAPAPAASQRLSLPDGISSHGVSHHHQLLNEIEQEVRADPGTVISAVIEARPWPSDEPQRTATGESSDTGSHGRLSFEPPTLSQVRHPTPPSPTRAHREPSGANRAPLTPPSVEGRPTPPEVVPKPSAALETNRSARHAGPAGDSMLVDQNTTTLGLDGMDFVMSDIPFDATDYDLAFLMGAHHPSPRTEAGIRLGAGVGVGGRDRRAGSNEVSAMFDHHNDLGLNWPPPAHSRTMDDRSSSSAIETDRSRDRSRATSTNAEHQQQQSPVLQPPGCYIDLIKLQLELVEDHNVIETQAPLDGRPVPTLHECGPTIQSRFINRVLTHSSRFWDMLKGMSAAAESQKRRVGSSSRSNNSTSSNVSSNGYNMVGINGNGHGPPNSNSSGSSDGHRADSSSQWRPGWSRAGTSDSVNHRAAVDLDLDLDLYVSMSPMIPQRTDHVLIMNLVLTYLYLLRSCRAVFVRLLQALEETPAESQSPLRLPSLHFGDFQLENNLAIQVKVLVEMMSGMLLRIGNTLGISPAGVIVPVDGNASPPADDRDCRLPFMSDPMAISLREIILSQERVAQGAATHAAEAPLPEVMASLRRLLGRRYSIV